MAYYILKIEDEAATWFILRKGKKMLKTKVWDAQCRPSPLPPLASPPLLSPRAGLLGDAALLKTEVSLATCPKISCELNLFHGFAYGAAL